MTPFSVIVIFVPKIVLSTLAPLPATILGMEICPVFGLNVSAARSILQIKTPVNIWLYKYFPENIEVFMKIYF